jgi:choline-sulfatase
MSQPISTRREFLAQSAAGLATASLAPGVYASAPGPHNAIILIVDEHNPRYSALCGHPLVETPNLRRMMARGTVYERCYAPSPLCAPSRSSFLSGLPAHRHQQYSNCTIFRAEHPTYAQALTAAGVHTVHAGKSDFYCPVEKAGFSEVLRSVNRDIPGDTSISRHPLAIRVGEGQQRGAAYGPVEHDPWAVDNAVVADALAWLETKPATLGKPFTLVVNVNAPHFPHYVTPALWEKYAAGATLPEHGPDVESAQHPYAVDLRNHFETWAMTEAQIRGQRRGYLGCVEYVDSLAGKFIDLLDRTGLAANTSFIYTSDHGEMLGKFGMWWKSSLYEDSARVPCVAMGPGFAAGQRVRTPVDLHDVNAALFHATAVARPQGWRGAALQQISLDDPDRALFAEYHGHGTRGSGYLIRKGPWKLIWCAEAPHQLFNLDDDPEELRNLYDAAHDETRALEQDLRGVCDPMAEHQRAEEYIVRQRAAIMGGGTG